MLYNISSLSQNHKISFAHNVQLKGLHKNDANFIAYRQEGQEKRFKKLQGSSIRNSGLSGLRGNYHEVRNWGSGSTGGYSKSFHSMRDMGI